MDLSMITKLQSLLDDAEIKGTLNGREFSSTSFKGSGKRALVLKGWAGDVAIRYRAAWSDLLSGEVFYQAHKDKGWEETEETDLQPFVRADSVGVRVSFTREDGSKHIVTFEADINPLELFKF